MDNKWIWEGKKYYFLKFKVPTFSMTNSVKVIVDILVPLKKMGVGGGGIKIILINTFALICRWCSKERRGWAKHVFQCVSKFSQKYLTVVSD